MDLSGGLETRQRRCSSGWLIVLALIGALSASASAQSLEVELMLVRDVTSAKSVRIQFELKNDGTQTMQVLRWNTPFEGHRSWIFDVECEGRPVDYQGPIVKRSNPRQEHYVEVPVGESRIATIDLAAAYALPPSGGSCSARWNGELRDVVEAETAPRVERRALTPTQLSTKTIRFTLTPVADFGEPSFVGCTSEEERILRTASPNSERLARDARDALQGVAIPDRPSYKRYRTWFGLYDASRYSSVSLRYESISGAARGTVKFNCTGSGSCGGVPAACDPGDYAFTCGGGANQTIWLCGGFWRAPAMGRDSQAGTLVHELSHWFGTRDFAYTCPRCQDLASRDPATAVRNADNTEYFAENFGLQCN